MSTTPQWAVMPTTDWDNIIAAVKEQTEDDTPLLSGEVAVKIKSITARPVPIEDLSYFYQNNLRLEQIDDIDHSKARRNYQMFKGANSLQAIPQDLKTSEEIDGTSMCEGCSALIEIKLDDIGSMKKLNSFAKGCTSLKKIILGNTGNVEAMSSFAQSCGQLEYVSLDNTNNVKSLSSAFMGCSKLKSVKINVSNVTAMDFALQGCYSLTEIIFIGDLSNCTTLQKAFHTLNPAMQQPCKFPEYFNTRNCYNFNTAFQGANFANDITIDISSATDLNAAFFAAAKTDKTITLICSENTTNINGLFNGSVNVYNQFVFTGVLSKNQTVTVNISVAVAKNILTILKDQTGTANNLVYTIKLSDATWNALDAEGSTAPNGKTWKEYVDSKGYLY